MIEVIFIGWLVLAFLTALLCGKRDCNLFTVFLLSFLLSPIYGIIYAAFSGRKKTEYEAFKEADYYLEKGLITEEKHKEMVEDIKNEIIKPIRYYK